MKYHYVYKITNLITGHYYIGAHSTSDLFDGYMGSGVLIRLAIKYYGVSNFDKVVLKMCYTRKAMFAQERLIINKSIVLDPNSYNLITGGSRRTKNTYKVKARTKNCKELLMDRI